MTERLLPLLNKTEAAAYLGVSIRTLERLMRDKELSPIYITRRPAFTYDDLNALAERNRIGGRHAA
jgi:excisionase family DNA binding protein